MPRRSSGRIQAGSALTIGPAQPPRRLSPVIEAMRQDWRWASISAFCSMFLSSLGGVEWNSERFEEDMDGNQSLYIPFVMEKLLYTLTLNRHINSNNWQEHVRRQYLKRRPDANMLGDLDFPREWYDLDLYEKLEAINQVCDWHMQDSTRFRNHISYGDPDMEAGWRMEPIGWDKDQNAYFLFDDNRLWRKHAAPPTAHILKRPSKKAKIRTVPDDSEEEEEWDSSRSLSGSLSPPPPPSSDAEEEEEEEEEEEGETGSPSLSRRARPPSTAAAVTPTTSRRPRRSAAAASSAAVAAAYALVVDDDVAAEDSSSGHFPPPAKKTRLTRRSRAEDDTWQEIPEAWLSPAKKPEEEEEEEEREEQKEGDGDDDASEDKEEAEDEPAAGDGDPEEPEEGKVAQAGDAAIAEPKKEEPSVDEEMLKEEAPRISDKAVKPEEKDAGKEDVEMADAQAKEDGEDAESTPPKERAQQEDDNLFVASKPAASEDAPTETPSANGALQANATADQTPTAEEQLARNPAEGAIEVTDERKEVVVPILMRPVDESLKVEIANADPNDRWEVVCVSRWDWETFPENFALSRQADEKALYRYLKAEVAPLIIPGLIEIERELKHQESVNRGKRTTRLSAVEIKQSDLMGPRTSERRAERQREAERAYKEREEAEQLAKERAREERQREREERALQRQEAIVRQREKEELDRVEALEREKLAEELRLNPHKSGTKTTAKLKELTKAATTPKGKKQTPRKTPDVAKKGQQKAEEEDWILNCEVCKIHARNPEGEFSIACCEGCGEWQHTVCHDSRDVQRGRKPRDWEKDPFNCASCRNKQQRKEQRARARARAQAAQAQARADGQDPKAKPSPAAPAKAAAPPQPLPPFAQGDIAGPSASPAPAPSTSSSIPNGHTPPLNGYQKPVATPSQPQSPPSPHPQPHQPHPQERSPQPPRSYLASTPSSTTLPPILPHHLSPHHSVYQPQHPTSQPQAYPQQQQSPPRPLPSAPLPHYHAIAHGQPPYYPGPPQGYQPPPQQQHYYAPPPPPQRPSHSPQPPPPHAHLYGQPQLSPSHSAPMYLPPPLAVPGGHHPLTNGHGGGGHYPITSPQLPPLAPGGGGAARPSNNGGPIQLPPLQHSPPRPSRSTLPPSGLPFGPI